MKISSFFALLLLVTTGTSRAQSSIDYVSNEDKNTTHSFLRGKDNYKDHRDLQNLVCTTLATTGFFKLITRHSNLVLSVEGLSMRNGAPLIQYFPEENCITNWRFQCVGNGYYNIIAEHSGKAINVLGGGKNNGNSIVQWDLQPGPEDDWCFVDRGAGFYSIYNRGSGKVLDVQGASKQPGAKIHQWDFVNGSNQLWRIQPKSSPVLVPTPQQRPVMAPTPQQRPVLAPTPQQRPVMAPTPQLACAALPTTGFFKLTAKHSRLGLTAEGLSMRNGAQLMLYYADDDTIENWRFQSAGNGYYNIITEHGWKAVLGAGKNNGDSIVQWDVQPRPEYDWCFVDRGAGFYAIYNRGSGKVIGVQDASIEPKAKINQWDFINGSNQLWRIEPV